MAEASLRYLLLWYILVTCYALEVRPIPYGVLIHQEGEARIQDSSYEIVFVLWCIGVPWSFTMEY